MPLTSYLRSIPFRESQLEDIKLQYIPAQSQLIITFYYQNIQFACLCSKVGESLVPVRVINHLRKDDQNMRARFLVSLLNDRLEELYRAISTAHRSFDQYVRREIGIVHRA